MRKLFALVLYFLHPFAQTVLEVQNTVYCYILINFNININKLFNRWSVENWIQLIPRFTKKYLAFQNILDKTLTHRTKYLRKIKNMFMTQGTIIICIYIHTTSLHIFWVIRCLLMSVKLENKIQIIFIKKNKIKTMDSHYMMK